MFGDILQLAKYLKLFQQAFEDGKDGKTNKDVLIEKFGMDPEEAERVAGKMDEAKKLILDKVFKGEVKSPEDVMTIIKESGLIDKDTFDSFIKKFENGKTDQ